jgi:two-component system sensor histidine kinase/response regulator
MLGLHSTVQCHIAPAAFGQLYQLLQQFSQTLPDALVLSNTEFSALPLAPLPSELDKEFFLIWSPSFKVLLNGRWSPTGLRPSYQERIQPRPTTHPQPIALGFAGEEIWQFGQALLQFYPYEPVLQQLCDRSHWATLPNDPQLQSQFTLQLIGAFSQSEPSPYPAVSVCQPVEQALQRQVDQSQLLNHVCAQICQSLDLEMILRTTLEELRQLLHVDRVMIHHFLPSPEPDPGNGKGELKQIAPEHYQGYESKGRSDLPSGLDPNLQPTWMDLQQNWYKYLQGYTISTTDVGQTYHHHPTLLRSLQTLQIQASITVPILIQGNLWGLLTAHHCDRPHVWQPDEQESLEHVAKHLEIAIYQTQLYQQLRQQKQTLEERVQQYTQELQSTLIAAQAANKAKSDFLATMSHELRTPLTCVIGMSSTLLHWSFGSLSDRQRTYLQTIHDNGERLLEVINDILEFCQLEAGKTVLNISRFSLTHLVQDCRQMFQEQARSAHVNLKVENYLTPQQDEFFADVRRVQQILINLISNAIKFTPAQGTVTLRLWWENSGVVFQVEDTGIGIAESQYPLLFEKFQQLDTSLCREYGGTGLGLALTKQFIDLHQGSIRVDSQLGAGSTFTVRLPLQTPRKPLPKPKPDPEVFTIPDALPTGQVIVLEDEEETATLICELLTAAGYQVIWLVDCSTAIDQIEFLKPVAVIANLHMAGVASKEIVQALQRSPDVQFPKVVALAPSQSLVRAASPEGNRAASPEENRLCDDPHQPKADIYLSKPLDPEKLLTSLINLTHRS